MIDGTRSLFVWSLRSDSRALYPHVVRAIFCCLILLTVFIVWSTSATATSPPGLMLFAGISYTNVAVIWFAGISYFVSAVTEEKDSGSLALLKLAGVTPLAIVLSKSVSRQIAALALLMVQLPFTQLAVTLGGITPQQILATYLALIGWLLLVSNFALLCSVLCRTTGKAAALATIVTLIFLIAGPCLDALLSLSGTRWMPPAFTNILDFLKDQQQSLLVIPTLDSILNANAQVPLWSGQLIRSLMAGAIFMSLSVLLFETFSGESQRPEHGRTKVVRRFLVNRSWPQAIAWKDFVFFGGGKTVWLVKLAGYALILIAYSVFQQLDRPMDVVPFSSQTARAAFATIAVLVSLELTLYASNSLFLEIHSRTAAGLLMLPSGNRTIFWQKTLAVLLAVSPGLLIALGLLIGYHNAIGEISNWPAVLTGWILITGFLIHACVLLSMYFRWAALPIAAFITMLLSPIFFAAAAATLSLAIETNDHASWANWLGIAFTLGWWWLFVLLPMELEISASWKRCGVKS